MKALAAEGPEDWRTHSPPTVPLQDAPACALPQVVALPAQCTHSKLALFGGEHLASTLMMAEFKGILPVLLADISSCLAAARGSKRLCWALNHDKGNMQRFHMLSSPGGACWRLFTSWYSTSQDVVKCAGSAFQAVRLCSSAHMSASTIAAGPDEILLDC